LIVSGAVLVDDPSVAVIFAVVVAVTAVVDTMNAAEVSPA